MHVRTTPMIIWAAMFFILPAASVTAQSTALLKRMAERHDRIRVEGLEERRYLPEQINAALLALDSLSGFAVGEAGRSIEGRPIYSVRWGHGPVRILMWTQMHGDEPTATMALLDLFEALHQPGIFPESRQWADKVTLHVLPLLNPDGAYRYQRRNVIGIDLNRDALDRTTPEARLLWHWRDSLDPRWGFNLHDQHRYYSVGQTDRNAALAFLAPPPDPGRSTPPHRSEAMKLIAWLHKGLQGLIPGQVARYSDAFEPRAFGDQFTAAGTATVLIEAGWMPGDLEKQELRRLYFATLAASLQAIATRDHMSTKEADYHRIPYNQNRMFDLLIRDARLPFGDQHFRLDIGIKRHEREESEPGQWTTRAAVEDMGDLSPFTAFTTLDARDARLVPAKTYGHVLDSPERLADVPLDLLVEQGVAVFRIQGLPPADRYLSLPFALRLPADDASEPVLPGANPVFYLADDQDRLRWLVVNGLLWDLSKDDWRKALHQFVARGHE